MEEPIIPYLGPKQKGEIGLRYRKGYFRLKNLGFR